MITFKSITDVEQFRNHPLHATVKELFSMVIAEYPDYRPEDDGYLVLIEPAEVDRVPSDLDMPWRLSEVAFEGITVVDGYFHAVYLANNQFGLGFLIPDEDWLHGEWRRALEHHMELLTCRYAQTISIT